MNLRSFTLAAIGTGALLASSGAQAAPTPLDISSAVNSNLYTYTGGTSYPPAGSTVTITGANGPVGFVLANFYPVSFNAPDVGVVQAGNGGPTSITINTPDYTITGPTTFYSLINSAFGVSGATIGDLTLNFATGSSYIYSLTEGVNVRDHYNGIYNNVAVGAYGTATYNSGLDRFDAQQIVLPATYIGNTLTSITLNNPNTAGGNPFLAAFTAVPAAVTAVPEPASWALMIGGFGAIGMTLRRRRAAATGHARAA